jgi:hypothetical protein
MSLVCFYILRHNQAQIAFTIARPNVKIYLQNELSSLGVNTVWDILKLMSFMHLDVRPLSKRQGPTKEEKFLA